MRLANAFYHKGTKTGSRQGQAFSTKERTSRSSRPAPLSPSLISKSITTSLVARLLTAPYWEYTPPDLLSGPLTRGFPKVTSVVPWVYSTVLGIQLAPATTGHPGSAALDVGLSQRGNMHPHSTRRLQLYFEVTRPPRARRGILLPAGELQSTNVKSQYKINAVHRRHRQQRRTSTARDCLRIGQLVLTSRIISRPVFQTKTPQERLQRPY